MRKPSVVLSLALLIVLSTSCIQTSKITRLYNNGARLKSSDVVLFTGYNGEHSRVSNSMLAQTKRLLNKYGVEVHYLHTSDFNGEIVNAGLSATKVDVNNEDFLNKMTQVYGLSYIFNVSHIKRYEGEYMAVDRNTKMLDDSGIVFEVYSVLEREVVASMEISGNSIDFMEWDQQTGDNYGGSIFNNYAKGLRKLMKASK